MAHELIELDHPGHFSDPQTPAQSTTQHHAAFARRIYCDEGSTMGARRQRQHVRTVSTGGNTLRRNFTDTNGRYDDSKAVCEHTRSGEWHNTRAQEDTTRTRAREHAQRAYNDAIPPRVAGLYFCGGPRPCRSSCPKNWWASESAHVRAITWSRHSCPALHCWCCVLMPLFLRSTPSQKF